MENKLEQLLNILIEKGWLPRGEDKIHSCKFDKRENKFMAKYIRSGCFKVMYRSLTELCSKSSGLWQFVCENGMCVAGERPYRGKFYEELFPDYEAQTYSNNMIIESSLKDESELESFILDNIKV